MTVSRHLLTRFDTELNAKIDTVLADVDAILPTAIELLPDK
jgi:hypothetical protein